MSTRYIVIEGHTLGYQQDGMRSNSAGVLAATVGGYDWKNGSVPVSEQSTRPATLADFERFRVVPPPGFDITP